MAVWTPDAVARPRSAAVRQAVLDALADGPASWVEIAERAAQVADVTPAFADALVAAGCRAGELSWTGTAAHAGRTLHLGQVPGAGIACRTAPPRPLPPLPPRVDIEALLRLTEAGVEVLPTLDHVYDEPSAVSRGTFR